MKKTALALTLSLALLISAVAVVQTVKAQYTPDGQAFIWVSPLSITSPSNTTYTSNSLTLNVGTKSLVALSDVMIVYNIDEGANVTIPVEKTFVPITVQDVYPNGTTITTTSSIWSYYLLNGTVVLPDLSNGGHCLTVYAHYQVPTSDNSVGLDTKTIYFTINNGIPPVISNLSLENKTYNQDNLPLNFTVDEPTSWIGYCLDGQDNVTVTENFTLTELPSGSHTLTIYTNDTVGNMGTSSTIAFSVAEPEPFPTVLVAVASVIAIVVVGAGLLVYFKKSKHGAMRS